jgi:hypothetical protein
MYKRKLVEVGYDQTRNASWVWGKRKVRGVEHIYNVKDWNFPSLNEWTFAVRVPSGSSKQIIVQPTQVPSKKAWAGLERRTNVWVPATINPYRKKVYCKVHIADPTQEKNWIGVSRGRRNDLPRWFRTLRHRLRLKNTVTTTRGVDKNDQVLLVKKGNYVEMIRLFFALRVWVLQEGFELPT